MVDANAEDVPFAMSDDAEELVDANAEDAMSDEAEELMAANAEDAMDVDYEESQRTAIAEWRVLAREDQGLHEIIDEVEEDLLAAGADVAKVRDILQATNDEIIIYALQMSEVEAAVVTAEIVDEILTVATRDGGTEDVPAAAVVKDQYKTQVQHLLQD